MEVKSYQSQAESLLKEYILADPLVPYTSIVGSIFACKMVYDLAQLISAVHFKSYSSFSNIQRVEWSNRAISTVHAIFITAMSLYFVFWSDLFLDNQLASLITFRSSFLSTFTLGVSVGYFLADLGMIIWFYPALGGMEYVIHHLLSIAATACAMLTREAQFYTYMVLISETTTPGINLRWYLDKAGMKRSRAYLINGILMFLAWLVAEASNCFVIDQVKQCRTCVQILVFSVPVVLFIMNAVWFSKIVKGLVKTLAKQQ
ncbi:TLC domain-containing protein [Citrus sinensis]|uniref:TLC domain-containing protein n=1 Tax=Citrus sinensis TaxID=2711 RepID=A0ACB8LB33_CITSI|nr:TLC domain-containing protein [Citrus sinensis]